MDTTVNSYDLSYGTGNRSRLVAAPPGVVIKMCPVAAPVGTMAVICEPEFTVKLALTPPKVTTVVPRKPPPVRVTWVPGGPLVGVELVMMGTTLKIVLLVSVPELEVTVTWLVGPSAGTTAIR